MLFKSLKWFCRPVVQIEKIQPVEVKWFRLNGEYWLQSKNPDDIIFPLTKNITFEQFSKLNLVFDPKLTLPQGVHMHTPIKEFILDTSSPKNVDISFNGKPFYIKNLASFPYYQSFKRVLAIPGNLHSLIRQNIDKYNLTEKQATVMTYYQELFKMQLKRLPSETLLSESQRRQIMQKIMENYKIGNPQKLWNFKIEELRLDRFIDSLDKKIDEFEANIENRYQRYRKLIAMVSIAHILGFGYAIFFVDYLGWDIIEPLTYTIGLFGTILAIFFFIRHRQDRSDETIKETLKRIITNSSQRVWLQDIKSKRDFYSEERDRIRVKIQILHMRSDYGFFRDFRIMQNTPPKDELIDRKK